MSPPSNFILLANVFMLLLSGMSVFLMARYGYYWQKNYGDSAVQEKYKWRILRLLMVLIAIGLISSVFNVIISFFA